MGRPLGSPNKIKSELATLAARMVKKGELHPDQVLQRLEAKALDPNDSEAVEAAKTLLPYVLPRQRLPIDLTRTHELGTSWEQVLLRVVMSDVARQRREELDEWRRRRALPSETIPDDEDGAAS